MKYIERPKRILEGKWHDLIGREDNAVIFQRAANKYRNQIVLAEGSYEIVRLLGWTDQYEDDYYWVYGTWRNGVVEDSCVGGFIRLKKYLPKFTYLSLDKVFEINNPMSWFEKEIEERGIIVK